MGLKKGGLREKGRSEGKEQEVEKWGQGNEVETGDAIKTIGRERGHGVRPDLAIIAEADTMSALPSSVFNRQCQSHPVKGGLWGV